MCLLLELHHDFVSHLYRGMLSDVSSYAGGAGKNCPMITLGRSNTSRLIVKQDEHPTGVPSPDGWPSFVCSDLAPRVRSVVGAK